MNLTLLLLSSVILLNACAMQQGYNPVASATKQTFLLNEPELAQVKLGMTQPQVHSLMGESIIIGYSSQMTNEDNTIKDASHFKPLLIKNPYKVESLNSKQNDYIVEYYVSIIKQPDGVVTDDELTPLIFQKGTLVGKGWEYLKNLR